MHACTGPGRPRLHVLLLTAQCQTSLQIEADSWGGRLERNQDTSPCREAVTRTRRL